MERFKILSMIKNNIMDDKTLAQLLTFFEKNVHNPLPEHQVFQYIT